MSAPSLRFDDPDRPGSSVEVPADAQATVAPGDRAGTAVVTTPDGRRLTVAGDYREVHVRIQAAAARAHEGGEVEQANTPVS
jgi:hypothetical protein